MHSHKIIHIATPNRFLTDILHKELGVSKILAQVLINRGIDNVKEAEKFLHAGLHHLLDPLLFEDMQKAIGILRNAASTRQKVLVFSDYDVDGLTSLALLKNTLGSLGLEVLHYIPNRVKEGYGLNKNVLELVRDKEVKVVITADCGTNSHEEIKALKNCGAEVIITDHHEPSLDEEASEASCVINPKVKGSGYTFRDLAGVGVAYKLCQAVLGDLLEDDLDLVCLGTIADAVPLVGENRIIAKEGLERLTHTKRIGLKTLMETSRIGDKKITPSFVSFILGPRINASGRVNTAETALQLLLSEEKEEAKRLAHAIEACNRQRQKIESVILQEAAFLIDKEVNFKEHKVMVVAKENWHTGVLGIVAAKLAERFYRPAILISLTDDLCKGSGRSIKNFHLFDAVLECSDLLESFGGHKHATGLAINRNNISDFKEKINRLAHERLSLEDLLPSIEIDMELRLSDISESLIRELSSLEPYGVGNPEPLFYARELRLKAEPRVLSRDTLKFWVTDGNVTFQAIGFGIGGFKASLLEADCFDLVFSPRIDAWQGQETLLLDVKEIFFRK